ncbi:MAG: Gfo/Idh/MocA family oxidoreductase [Pedobacter sp.]|nr:MAG: Gfo/Idh/MocA family oxidoreductase [Pedobacter sp.]
MGMIGGGKDAFIGAVHRMAANLDGLVELVCGAFSANPEKSKASGAALFLNPERCYANYTEMIEKEATLPAAERMQFVSIVTPNHLHFEPALLALEKGFHVLIDKPISFNLAQAKILHQKATEKKLQVCLTHTYSGYPMVQQAKGMIARGDLGRIRKIIVSYPQGWLAQPTGPENKQADWRTDPNRSGISGCMGDIGTHAAHLAEFMSGLEITELCADLYRVVEGRKLDDDGNVLLRFNNGANGILMASQIASGEENALSISIYGDKGGLSWSQMDPNNLILKWPDQPQQVYRTGQPYLLPEVSEFTRTPAGHPEGYIEAFANLYKHFALCISALSRGDLALAASYHFPSTLEGIRGMAFIENVVAASDADLKWHPFKI